MSGRIPVAWGFILLGCLAHLALAGCAASGGGSSRVDPGASASPPAPSADGGGAGIADTAIGLSHADLSDAPTPEWATPSELAPGEGPRIARAHPEAPPAIPHAIADFLPITRADNLCLDCHGTADMGAPMVPESHLRDLRHDPAKVRTRIAGSRWVCTSCHVTLTDAAPLVGNRFP